MSTVNEKLTAIADTIRSYTGKTEALTLDAMEDGIHEGNQATKDHYFTEGRLQGYETGHVEGYEAGNKDGYQTGYTAGHRDGHFEGYDTGKSEGKAEGIEQGKQAEYDAFWDAYQENGTRRKYEYAFSAQGWTDKTFKPKYNLILGIGYTGTNMFWGCTVPNLAEALEKQGVRLDTTLSGCVNSMFQSIVTERLPELNFSHVPDYSTSNGLLNTFMSASVKTIDKIIVVEKLKYNSTFNGCSNLEDITFEGVIGNNIAFAQSSKLTNASVQSIIDHLKDLTGATAQTLTLHATVKANLTEEQLATITGKNWSVA